MLFSKSSTIVFQGDSITDAKRRCNEINVNGIGYAAMTIDTLNALFPDYNLTLYNRGISGNRVSQLLERWDSDCLDLKPDVVTLLIGINDVWHSYSDSQINYDIKSIEENYTKIVEKTRATGAKIVIMEPFAFHHDAFKEEWRTRLWEVQQVVRNAAVKYADAFIPLDGIMYKAALTTPAVDLSIDGVHPTRDGHRIIARELLHTLGAI